MQKHKHCELIKAWADGRTIQYNDGEDWVDCEIPKWFPANVYRVKPEKVTRFIAVNVMTNTTTRLCDTRADCESVRSRTYGTDDEHWQIIEIEVTVP